MDKSRDRFWELMKPEHEKAVVFCRKLMGDRDSGDDLYQDALVKAMSCFEDLRDHGAFRSWLYRVMVTTFRSTVRRPWWKRRARLTDEHQEMLVGDNPLDQHTARRWLQRAFKAVSTDDQALVTLYELDQWTIAEVAELYGTSEGAIKTRLYRARRKMKQALTAFAERGTETQASTDANGGSQCAATKPGSD
ncbi:MAG: RNA polymerase sigma factor [candidate division Zixibacteria bacterium]|nr:RNA polymerase sigma factor [candidate division Zixibacteria bacterium]